MKTVTIRELHARTGEWVRQTAFHGEIFITDRGRTVARIVPLSDDAPLPYFANRKPGRKFAAIMNRLNGGTDSTRTISEDRDAR